MGFAVFVERYILREIAAVSYHESQSPSVFEDFLYIRIYNRRDTRKLVICHHYRVCSAAGYRAFKCRIVILVERPHIDIGRGSSTLVFGIVGAEMLQRRDGLKVLPVPVCKPFCVRRRHFSGQERVLSVALLVSAPERISAQVNGRSPQHQMAARGAFIQHPCLLACRKSRLFHKLRVKRSRKPDWLGEYGRRLIGVSRNISPCNLRTDIPLAYIKARHSRHMT